MTLKNVAKYLFFLIVVMFCFPAYAEEDPEKIYIEADSIKYDFKKGIVFYDGHVHATQGATDLQAENMVVYYNKNHKIKQVDAFGKLAQYKTLVHEAKDQLTASAEKISYYPLANNVILRNQAVINYNNSVFTGPVIFYDMTSKVITSHPNQSSQAKIILEPIKDLKRDN